MLGLSNLNGIPEEPYSLEEIIDKVLISLRTSGMYNALTLEMVSDTIQELKSVYEEVESYGIEAFLNNHGMSSIISDINEVGTLSEAAEVFLMMYRSLIASYEQIYEDKARENRTEVLNG